MMMINIDAVRCNGCGECVEACPAGAITLQDQVAVIDEAYCQECEVCLDACPNGAILAVEILEAYPARGGEPMVVREPAGAIETRSAVRPVSARSLILPMIGSALYWAGCELVPRLAHLALDSLNRRIVPAGPTTADLGIGPQGRSSRGGRQERRRRQRSRKRTRLAQDERR
jgi:ferredoxin